MKTFLLILTILFFFTTLSIGALYLMKDNVLQESKVAYDSLHTLYTSGLTEYADLQKEYDDLEKVAYPRVFPSKSTLEEWAKENTSYNSQTSYSEDAVKLMEIAREDGYWLGIVPAEKSTTNSKLTMQLPVYPYYTGTNLYFFNVAVVGESDVYLVDPATGTVLKSAEMLARMRW